MEHPLQIRRDGKLRGQLKSIEALEDVLIPKVAVRRFSPPGGKPQEIRVLLEGTPSPTGVQAAVELPPFRSTAADKRDHVRSNLVIGVERDPARFPFARVEVSILAP
jgi:hypothetical protein